MGGHRRPGLLPATPRGRLDWTGPLATGAHRRPGSGQAWGLRLGCGTVTQTRGVQGPLLANAARACFHYRTYEPSRQGSDLETVLNQSRMWAMGLEEHAHPATPGGSGRRGARLDHPSASCLSVSCPDCFSCYRLVCSYRDADAHPRLKTQHPCPVSPHTHSPEGAAPTTHRHSLIHSAH